MNNQTRNIIVLVASFVLAVESKLNLINNVAPASTRIIGGNETIPHLYPFQVGLRINRNAFCGGSLISPNYVLTAAHCGIVINSVDIILGAHNISNPLESTQVTIPGTKVLVHENYNTKFYNNDISLIQLSSPAPINDYIQPVQLPNRNDSTRDYLNALAVAIGWGLIEDNPFPTTSDISDVLLQVEVPVSNLTECGYYYNEVGKIYVTDTNICTSGYKNKGTCQGDSGGPLILDGVLIGITSFGNDLCEFCSPSVYTKVADYLDWIEENSDVEL